MITPSAAPDFFTRHWRAVATAIVVLILINVALWLRGESAQHEANALRARVNLASTLAAEQKKLDEATARLADVQKRADEIEQRNRELYPEIERQRAESGRLWTKIQARLAQLKELDRHNQEAEVQNMDIRALAEELNRRGFPVTVMQVQP